MTITETVLLLVGILNLILLIINLSMFKDLTSIKILIGQIHAGLGQVGAKLQSQEVYMQKLGSSFTEFTNIIEDALDKLDFPWNMMQGKPSAMFKTIDGKYTATTLEDLIEKIKKDGVESNYLSQDELNNLRRLFDTDDDEDEDDDFNPNKGKF